MSMDHLLSVGDEVDVPDGGNVNGDTDVAFLFRTFRVAGDNGVVQMPINCPML